MPLYHVTTRERVPFIRAEGLPVGTRGALRDVFRQVAPRETLLFDDRALESLLEKAEARHPGEEIVVLEVAVEPRNADVHEPVDARRRSVSSARRLGAYTSTWPWEPEDVAEVEVVDEEEEGADPLVLDLREVDEAEAAARVLELADAVPRRKRFGDRKVFVADAYKEATDRGFAGELGQFKDLLLTLHQQGELILQRADLVPAMPRGQVRRSEIVYRLGPGDDVTATFHFIELPGR